MVLLEVLRRLKRMSKISIDILKETGIGLIVNKLRLESPDEEVRSAAVSAGALFLRDTCVLNEYDRTH